MKNPITKNLIDYLAGRFGLGGKDPGTFRAVHLLQKRKLMI
jgi:hypothetical protein